MVGLPVLDRDALGQLGPAARAEARAVLGMVDPVLVPPVGAGEPAIGDRVGRLDVVGDAAARNGQALASFRARAASVWIFTSASLAGE